MKVSYHAYCLRYTGGNGTTRHLFNIQDILETLINHETSEFKSSFMYGDEHLYLLKEDPKSAPHTYFFLITRNNELVKAINSSDVSMQDIRDKIGDNESIGFGSFLHVWRDSCVAFIGQFSSPKIDLFWYYINQYLGKIASPGLFDVIGQPLMAKATIDQVMHMKRIGKTTIEVGMRHTIAQALAALFSKNTGEQGIESIQITINPKRSKDAKPFLENLPQLMDDDVRKLVAKAEDDIFSSITDLYVVGNGGLCDSINPNPRISSNVERLIGDKMQDNQVLSQKLSEYRKPDTYEHTLPQQLLGILESRRSNARQN